MIKKCEKCGSTNVKEGKLGPGSYSKFISNGQKGIFLKASGITAYACKDCGCVFDLKLEHPEKI